jgi:RNA-binding protein 26
MRADPAAFVNDVFETVAYKSYLPGAPPPPSKRAPAPTAFPQQNLTAPPAGGLSYDDNVAMAQAPAMSVPQKGRKRGWNDSADGEGLQGPTDAGARPGKRAIRNGRRGRGATADDRIGAAWETAGQVPQIPGVPDFDANAAFNAFMKMGFPGNIFSAQPPPGRRRQRCRDYDTKGFCARANTCMFQHGDDPVYPPALFGGQAMGQLQGVEGSLICGGVVSMWLTCG